VAPIGIFAAGPVRRNRPDEFAAGFPPGIVLRNGNMNHSSILEPFSRLCLSEGALGEKGAHEIVAISRAFAPGSEAAAAASGRVGRSLECLAGAGGIETPNGESKSGRSKQFQRAAGLPEWQAAIEALILVADLGGPTMFARIGVMRALNRHVERVFNPDRKDDHWGKRNLKRDQ
jgi:hypothetical protein